MRACVCLRELFDLRAERALAGRERANGRLARFPRGDRGIDDDEASDKDVDGAFVNEESPEVN